MQEGRSRYISSHHENDAVGQIDDIEDTKDQSQT